MISPNIYRKRVVPTTIYNRHLATTFIVIRYIRRRGGFNIRSIRRVINKRLIIASVKLLHYLGIIYSRYKKDLKAVE